MEPSLERERSAEAFSNQVIQQGAVGDDVIELQSRLQYLGFYNGKIDGVFGWKTYWALRNFQYEFGLPIDGLAGTKTKQKLAKASNYNEKFVKNQINSGKKFSHYGGVDLEKQKTPSANESGTSKETQKGSGGTKSGANNNAANNGADTSKSSSNNAANNGAGTSKSSSNNGSSGTANSGENTKGEKPTAANVPNGFSQNDIQLMANAVYGESRGEPYTGQVAVAAVILNRVNSPSFPNTVSGVIFEPRAFTAVADGQIWLTPNEKAKEAVLDAINGWDPTGNALYYFNPDTATSGWIWTRPQIKQIGKHIFCK
ncbi:spore cortex-lytic enzyme [Niallia nealsonii]|uniref:Spore cortex-lytic enzyme n=1 Tax=Niallia nealsonii TaxID=115979 RepID=A0A2N0Z3U8_9BACI|nr:spore cortex-lytic enzyme [Niallia nealsonii]